MKFRKQPVVIDAWPFDGSFESVHGIEGLKEARWFAEGASGRPACVEIRTLEGVMTAMPGDYIIRGVKGEFYPCKPDIFAATYSPLPDDEGIAKENEDGWDILICQSCGQDVGRGRPGAGVTILKCVPCSQLSTEVLRESPPAKEKNVPQTSTLERLDALAARPDLRQQGWDSYGANPLDDRAIEAARAFLGYAWAVGPTSNGGIQLEIHCSGFDIEIEFDETGKAETASAEVFGEIPRVRPLDEQLEMLTRYDAVSSWETALMREKAYGEYVRYADVEKLVAPRVRDVPSPAVEQGRLQAIQTVLDAMREFALTAPSPQQTRTKSAREMVAEFHYQLEAILRAALSVEAPTETKEQP